MDCFEAGILMLKELEGKAGDRETDALMRHLMECSDCLRHFRLLEELIKDSQSESTPVRAPEDFEIQVMTKIRNINAITVVRTKVVKYR